MHNFFFGLSAPVISATFWWLWIRFPFISTWYIACAGVTFAGLVSQDAHIIEGATVSLLIAALIDFYQRHRKRARRWLGAKSRALRAALVRKMREAARPGLRPVRVPA